ncbi:MAG: hypothetical protein PHU23_10080 [Dehalococcoidales bacterium]|nr:hypothetical protein [Dehalococcoidales bacterium]
MALDERLKRLEKIAKNESLRNAMTEEINRVITGVASTFLEVNGIADPEKRRRQFAVKFRDFLDNNFPDSFPREWKI